MNTKPRWMKSVIKTASDHVASMPSPLSIADAKAGDQELETD